MTTTINASTSSGLVVTPDNSGNVVLQYNGVSAPAFRARPATSTQSVSNNTWTKITLGTEDFDTANCFASSTFTPTVAGYYQLNGSVYCTNSSGNMTQARCNIYKNGSTEVYGGFYLFNGAGDNNTDSIATVSGLVYLNGSTDYVELYGYIGGSSTSPVFAGYTSYTIFSGCLLRGA